MYHGVVKHPLFMVSSFIGVSHKRHPSASSVVVVRHCCRLGRICPSYLLISLCFLSCSMLPCVWKQCLDTYVRFDFLCPSPLMVVTNSLRRCVGAVNAFNALSLPSVFRSWATVRGRRYPLPSIDMVIHHRRLSCIAFLSSSCCRSRSSSSATDLWKGLSRVALRRRRRMLSSLSSLSIIHLPSSIPINHTYVIVPQATTIVSSSRRIDAGPLSTVADPCISPPKPTHPLPAAPLLSPSLYRQTKVTQLQGTNSR